MRLEVVDDGRGLPQGTLEGNGLRGRRERARGGGGSMRVDARPTGGTRLEVTLPTTAPAGTPSGAAARRTRETS